MVMWSSVMVLLPAFRAPDGWLTHPVGEVTAAAQAGEPWQARHFVIANWPRSFTAWQQLMKVMNVRNWAALWDGM